MTNVNIHVVQCLLRVLEWILLENLLFIYFFLSDGQKTGVFPQPGTGHFLGSHPAVRKRGQGMAFPLAWFLAGCPGSGRGRGVQRLRKAGDM